LVIYAILCVLAGFLVSEPGGRVGWFGIMGLFAILPIIAGPKVYRLVGVLGLSVAMCAAVIDVHAVTRLREHQEKDAPAANRPERIDTDEPNTQP